MKRRSSYNTVLIKIQKQSQKRSCFRKKIQRVKFTDRQIDKNRQLSVRTKNEKKRYLLKINYVSQTK